MELAIRVQDPSGTVVRDVQVRADEANTVHDLVEVLVDVMEWPRQTVAGGQVVYEARLLGTPEPLKATSTIASFGLVRRDALILGPARLDLSPGSAERP